MRSFRPSTAGIRSALGGALAASFFFCNVVGLYAQEQNFWSSRRAASHKMHPGGSNVSDLGNQGDILLAQLPNAARVDIGSAGSVMASPSDLATFPAAHPGSRDWIAKNVSPHGWVRESYLSPKPNSPVVLHIQDAHGIEEAQRNISSMLGDLTQEGPFNLVGLEGASGSFALDRYRDFPDPSITRDIADFLLTKGLIAGPEYAGLTLPRSPAFYGAEEASLYDGNVQALKTAYKNKAAVLATMGELRNSAQRLKKSIFSESLKTFDRHFEAYKAQQEKLGDYVRFLVKTPGGRDSGENVQLLLKALEREERLDFKQVETDRRRLVEVLVHRLSKPALEDLVARSVDYRAGRLGFGDYHRLLRDVCAANKIRLEDFGTLSQYIDYVLLAEKIDRNDLMTELANLEIVAQNSLAKSPAETTLMNIARDMALLGKLLRHEMAMADWVAYEKRRPDILSLRDRLASLDPAALQLPSLMSEVLKPFEDFCSYAVRRNDALVSNMLAHMAEKGATTGVLVAGGFHTEGMTRLLREKQISYVVVTPKITNVPKENDYLDILARDPVPLEKILVGDRIYLSHPIALAEPDSPTAILANGLEKVLRTGNTAKASPNSLAKICDNKDGSHASNVVHLIVGSRAVDIVNRPESFFFAAKNLATGLSQWAKFHFVRAASGLRPLAKSAWDRFRVAFRQDETATLTRDIQKFMASQDNDYSIQQRRGAGVIMNLLSRWYQRADELIGASQKDLYHGQAHNLLVPRLGLMTNKTVGWSKTAAGGLLLLSGLLHDIHLRAFEQRANENASSIQNTALADAEVPITTEVIIPFLMGSLTRQDLLEVQSMLNDKLIESREDRPFRQHPYGEKLRNALRADLPVILAVITDEDILSFQKAAPELMGLGADANLSEIEQAAIAAILSTDFARPRPGWGKPQEYIVHVYKEALSKVAPQYKDAVQQVAEILPCMDKLANYVSVDFERQKKFVEGLKKEQTFWIPDKDGIPQKSELASVEGTFFFYHMLILLTKIKDGRIDLNLKVEGEKNKPEGEINEIEVITFLRSLPLAMRQNFVEGMRGFVSSIPKGHPLYEPSNAIFNGMMTGEQTKIFTLFGLFQANWPRDESIYKLLGLPLPVEMPKTREEPRQLNPQPFPIWMPVPAALGVWKKVGITSSLVAALLEGTLSSLIVFFPSTSPEVLATIKAFTLLGLPAGVSFLAATALGGVAIFFAIYLMHKHFGVLVGGHVIGGKEAKPTQAGNIAFTATLVFMVTLILVPVLVGFSAWEIISPTDHWILFTMPGLTHLLLDAISGYRLKKFLKSEGSLQPNQAPRPGSAPPLEIMEGAQEIEPSHHSRDQKAGSAPAGTTISPLGDLTPDEIESIQSAVNKANITVYVVGSAAKGSRRNVGTNLPFASFGQEKNPKSTRSAIDYVASKKDEEIADGLSLPEVSPDFGIRGVDYLNLSKGPAIKFSPNESPSIISQEERNIDLTIPGGEFQVREQDKPLDSYISSLPDTLYHLDLFDYEFDEKRNPDNSHEVVPHLDQNLRDAISQGNIIRISMAGFYDDSADKRNINPYIKVGLLARAISEAFPDPDLSLENTVKELLKNAVAHGAMLDFRAPAYLKIDLKGKSVSVWDQAYKQRGILHEAEDEDNRRVWARNQMALRDAAKAGFSLKTIYDEKGKTIGTLAHYSFATLTTNLELTSKMTSSPVVLKIQSWDQIKSMPTAELEAHFQNLIYYTGAERDQRIQWALTVYAIGRELIERSESPDKGHRPISPKWFLEKLTSIVLDKLGHFIMMDPPNLLDGSHSTIWTEKNTWKRRIERGDGKKEDKTFESLAQLLNEIYPLFPPFFIPVSAVSDDSLKYPDGRSRDSYATGPQFGSENTVTPAFPEQLIYQDGGNGLYQIETNLNSSVEDTVHENPGEFSYWVAYRVAFQALAGLNFETTTLSPHQLYEFSPGEPLLLWLGVERPGYGEFLTIVPHNANPNTVSVINTNTGEFKLLERGGQPLTLGLGEIGLRPKWNVSVNHVEIRYTVEGKILIQDGGSRAGTIVYHWTSQERQSRGLSINSTGSGVLTLESTYGRFGQTRLGAWIKETFGMGVFRRATQILAAPWMEAKLINNAKTFVDEHANEDKFALRVRLAATYAIHVVAAGVAGWISFSLGSLIFAPTVIVGGLLGVGLSGLALAPPLVIIVVAIVTAPFLGYLSTIPSHFIWNTFAVLFGWPALTWGRFKRTDGEMATAMTTESGRLWNIDQLILDLLASRTDKSGSFRVMDFGVGYPPVTTKELAEKIGDKGLVVGVDNVIPSAVLEGPGKDSYIYRAFFDGKGRFLNGYYIDSPIDFDEHSQQEAQTHYDGLVSRGEMVDKDGRVLVVNPLQVYGRKNLTFNEGSFESKWEDQFDLIRVFNVMIYYGAHNPEDKLKELAKNLKEGGRLVVGTATILTKQEHFVIYEKVGGELKPIQLGFFAGYHVSRREFVSGSTTDTTEDNDDEKLFEKYNPLLNKAQRYRGSSSPEVTQWRDRRNAFLGKDQWIDETIGDLIEFDSIYSMDNRDSLRDFAALRKDLVAFLLSTKFKVPSDSLSQIQQFKQRASSIHQDSFLWIATRNLLDRARNEFELILQAKDLGTLRREGLALSQGRREEIANDLREKGYRATASPSGHILLDLQPNGEFVFTGDGTGSSAVEGAEVDSPPIAIPAATIPGLVPFIQWVVGGINRVFKLNRPFDHQAVITRYAPAVETILVGLLTLGANLIISSLGLSDGWTIVSNLAAWFGINLGFAASHRSFYIKNKTGELALITPHKPDVVQILREGRFVEVKKDKWGEEDGEVYQNAIRDGPRILRRQSLKVHSPLLVLAFPISWPLLLLPFIVVTWFSVRLHKDHNTKALETPGLPALTVGVEEAQSKFDRVSSAWKERKLTISRYLGEGAFSNVFLAVFEGASYVIKTIKQKVGSGDSFYDLDDENREKAAALIFYYTDLIRAAVNEAMQSPGPLTHVMPRWDPRAQSPPSLMVRNIGRNVPGDLSRKWIFANKDYFGLLKMDGKLNFFPPDILNKKDFSIKAPGSQFNFSSLNLVPLFGLDQRAGLQSHGIIPPMMVNGPEIMMPFVVGKDFGELSDSAKKNAKTQINKAVSAGKKALGIENGVILTIEGGWRIKVDPNPHNFRFDDEGNISSWFDPIAPWPPKTAEKGKDLQVPKVPKDMAAVFARHKKSFERFMVPVVIGAAERNNILPPILVQPLTLSQENFPVSIQKNSRSLLKSIANSPLAAVIRIWEMSGMAMTAMVGVMVAFSLAVMVAAFAGLLSPSVVKPIEAPAVTQTIANPLLSPAPVALPAAKPVISPSVNADNPLPVLDSAEIREARRLFIQDLFDRVRKENGISDDSPLDNTEGLIREILRLNGFTSIDQLMKLPFIKTPERWPAEPSSAPTTSPRPAAAMPLVVDLLRRVFPSMTLDSAIRIWAPVFETFFVGLLTFGLNFMLAQLGLDIGGQVIIFIIGWVGIIMGFTWLHPSFYVRNSKKQWVLISPNAEEGKQIKILDKSGKWVPISGEILSVDRDIYQDAIENGKKIILGASMGVHAPLLAFMLPLSLSVWGPVVIAILFHWIYNHLAAHIGWPVLASSRTRGTGRSEGGQKRGSKELEIDQAKELIRKRLKEELDTKILLVRFSVDPITMNEIDNLLSSTKKHPNLSFDHVMLNEKNTHNWKSYNLIIVLNGDPVRKQMFENIIKDKDVPPYTYFHLINDARLNTFFLSETGDTPPSPVTNDVPPFPEDSSEWIQTKGITDFEALPVGSWIIVTTPVNDEMEKKFFRVDLNKDTNKIKLIDPKTNQPITDVTQDFQSKVSSVLFPAGVQIKWAVFSGHKLSPEVTSKLATHSLLDRQKDSLKYATFLLGESREVRAYSLNKDNGLKFFNELLDFAGARGRSFSPLFSRRLEPVEQNLRERLFGLILNGARSQDFENAVRALFDDGGGQDPTSPKPTAVPPEGKSSPTVEGGSIDYKSKARVALMESLLGSQRLNFELPGPAGFESAIERMADDPSFVKSLAAPGKQEALTADAFKAAGKRAAQESAGTLHIVLAGFNSWELQERNNMRAFLTGLAGAVKQGTNLVVETDKLDVSLDEIFVQAVRKGANLHVITPQKVPGMLKMIDGQWRVDMAEVVAWIKRNTKINPGSQIIARDEDSVTNSGGMVVLSLRKLSEAIADAIKAMRKILEQA